MVAKVTVPCVAMVTVRSVIIVHITAALYWLVAGVSVGFYRGRSWKDYLQLYVQRIDGNSLYNCPNTNRILVCIQYYSSENLRFFSVYLQRMLMITNKLIVSIISIIRKEARVLRVCIKYPSTKKYFCCRFY